MLQPLWESVKEEDVQTPLEVYRSIQEEGYRVDYLRLPITDEQAPIPNVFDQLVERLLGMKSNMDCIFNCQMGRGRTTTCIVITCLMHMIVGNGLLVQDPLGYIDDEDDTEVHLETDDDPRKRYVMGEWKVVLQLVAVLQYGKLAKKLTDKAIDMCEHIQNLRVAIYDYKIRIDALEAGTKKHTALLEIGVNYLVRYFYLIAFADYLLEVWAANERKGLAASLESSAALNEDQKFSEWLKDRREIVNIIRHQSLD